MNKVKIMDSKTPISAIMTRSVITLQPKDVMTDVEKVFRKNNIHHIPIIDDNGKVVGIVSKSDFFKIQHGMTLFKSRNVEVYNDTLMRSLLVEEVMTKQVATLHFEDAVSVAVGIFRENLFHALPVVDEEHLLVGIVTTHDLLNYAFREEIPLDFQ
jgi:acetoin utilization protein AcuB